MKHNYRYVQFVLPNNKIGYATFSINHEKSYDSNGAPVFTYTLGVAFCSPNDLFIKKIGRAKAAKMAAGDRRDPIMGVAPCTNEKNNNLKAIDFITILDQVINNKMANAEEIEFSCPNWVRKSWTKHRSSILLGLHKNAVSVGE